MKKIALILLFFISIKIQAQQNYCGTQPTAQDFAHYSNTVPRYQQNANSRATIQNVPLFYHLIGKADKTGLMKMSDIIQSHCELNNAYALSNIYFYIVGFDTIYDDNYFAFSSYSTGNQIMQDYNIANVCNVYINNSPAGNCGYAFFPNTATNDGIFINKGCHGPKSSTLMHEMGHYLGLMHTFEDWGGVEFVNGSNCSSAGDLFCDTPADFLDYRWTCPYNGTQTDPNGDLYRTVLDGSYYMSYANDACQDKFSPMQRVHTYNTLINERPNLIQSQPTISSIDTVQKIFPMPTDTAVNAAGVLFKWNKVPNATHYIFQIPTNVASFVLVDTIVTDTCVLITKLNANSTYKWRVRPYSFLYTCTNYTINTTFKTASIKVNASTVNNNCATNSNGTAQLSLVGGAAPFTYSWSNGDTTSAITNLTSGIYTYTITDSNGEIVAGSVSIIDANLFTAAINYSTNSLNAITQGGSAPYTFLWNTGATTSSITPSAQGQYTVTVTDANGCNTTTAFQYSNTAIEEAAIAAFDIVPNPIERGQFTIVLQDKMTGTIAISLIDIMGKIIFATQENLIQQHSINIALPNEISTGVYILSIENGAQKMYRKLVKK